MLDREERFLFVSHLFFLLTFQAWAFNPLSFSEFGRESLASIPLPLEILTWLPRPEVGTVSALLFGLASLSLLGMGLALHHRKLWSIRLLAGLLLAKGWLYLADLELLKPFHHMHMLLAALFLVTGSRIVFVRLGVVVIYVAAGLGKLNPSWLSGDYFNSVPGKLPWLPQWNWLVTSLSLAVVVLELVGPWLWLSSRASVRQATLLSFVAFHLYSGFIVGMSFPVLMLSTLWATFYPMEESLLQGYRWKNRDLAGWLLLGLVLLGSCWPFFLAGDVRLTGEGQYFSISNMFDANRSVVFESSLEFPDDAFTLRIERKFSGLDFYSANTVVTLRRAGTPPQVLLKPLLRDQQVLLHPSNFRRLNVRLIGDPYVYFQWMQQVQNRFRPLHFSGQLYQWLNSDRVPQRVFWIRDFGVERPEYSLFRHNEWLDPKPTRGVSGEAGAPLRAETRGVSGEAGAPLRSETLGPR